MIDDLYESQLSTVSEIMTEKPEDTPEHKLGMSIHSAFAAMDEIMAMGAAPGTKHLVISERRALHQLCSRAQLIASFVDAAVDQPGKIKMVVNNGAR